ncbi:MAG: histidine phosphatase family protein [Erysipelotrichaceae bacterium]|nr:histidine phosphatase family protein [Erysipelotrichaceae bacterium]
MTTFIFIRHGQPDLTVFEKKIYHLWGLDMVPLSREGIEQIRSLAHHEEIAKAQIILTPPLTRTLETAQILSKELGIDVVIEEGLHEWLPDKQYRPLDDDERIRRYDEMNECKAVYPKGEEKPWEDKDSMKERIESVLVRYLDYERVLVVTHGTLMQYYFGIDHPGCGQAVLMNAGMK